MPTRTELRQLARMKLREAEQLYDAGYYDGCAYLCGYVVELALKARICRFLGVTEYPELSFFKTHNFDILRLLAGLEARLVPGKVSLQLLQNWSAVIQWSPELRYSAPGTYSRTQALQLLDAIRDPKEGVLTWLSKRW